MTSQQNAMPYRRLGRTGVKVSVLGLGGSHSATSGGSITHDILDQAFRIGVTSSSYGLRSNSSSEDRLGLSNGN